MGGLVLGILVWQEGGDYVGLLMAIGAVALALLAYWLVRRKRAGEADAARPRPVQVPALHDRDLRADAAERHAGRRDDRAPDLPADDARVQRDADRPDARAALAQHVRVALLAGRKAGKRRPSNIVLFGFALSTVGMAAIIPIVPRTDSGWALVIPLLITGSGLGLLVSQLNNYTLSPIEEERVSEAAGVNSAAGSFGLSFGLAMAGGIMLAFLAFEFTNLVHESTVIPPAQQQQIADTLEDDAEVMSNAQTRAAARGRAG